MSKNLKLESKQYGLKNGLLYKYFEQQWFKLPNEIDAVPAKSGIASTIDVSRRNRNQGFIFQFDGYIKIPKTGAYRFYWRANALSKLIIGDNMLMESFGFSTVTKDYEIALEAGYHPIRVLHTNCWIPGQKLELWIEGPGIEKQIVTEKMLFHK